MSNLIISGNPAPIEQGYSIAIRRGTSGGVEVERAWMGTQDAILTQVGSLLGDESVTEISAQRSPGSAVALVRARFSVLPGDTTDHVEESLSLRWASPTLDIHRNPTFVGITSLRIGELETAVTNGSAPTDPTELKYYKLRRRGVSSYICKLPVVTYTRTAPRNTAETIDVSRSGKIVALAAIPVESFFELGSVNLAVSSGSDFTVGWMLTADADYLANGNAQLVETYEYGLWENDLYEFA